MEKDYLLLTYKTIHEATRGFDASIFYTRKKLTLKIQRHLLASTSTSVIYQFSQEFHERDRMFCTSASPKSNQKEGEMALILQEVVAPYTNNERRN